MKSCRSALLLLVLLSGCGRLPEKPAAPRTSEGEAVMFSSRQGPGQGVLFAPEGQGPFPALVAVHGDFGLDPWSLEQARRLAGRGFVVLAVDLYRGEKVENLLDAHIMDRGLPEERAMGDLRAAVRYLAARPEVGDRPVGVIGWDMGGGYALDLGVEEPRIRAVVTCYGRLKTEADSLMGLQAPVLGIYGGQDIGNPPSVRKDFADAMKKAGKRLVDLHVYEDCNQGFLAGTTEADRKAADDAWRRIEAFLKAELAGP